MSTDLGSSFLCVLALAACDLTDKSIGEPEQHGTGSDGGDTAHAETSPATTDSHTTGHDDGSETAHAETSSTTTNGHTTANDDDAGGTTAHATTGDSSHDTGGSTHDEGGSTAGDPCEGMTFPLCPEPCSDEMVSLCGEPCDHLGQECGNEIGDGMRCDESAPGELRWTCSVHPPLGMGCNKICEASSHVCDPWSYDKACMQDLECDVGVYPIDCCGNMGALGILTVDRTRFDEAQLACNAGRPTCDCLMGPIRVEDGHQTDDPNVIQAACQDGQCMAFVP